MSDIDSIKPKFTERQAHWHLLYILISMRILKHDMEIDYDINSSNWNTYRSFIHLLNKQAGLYEHTFDQIAEMEKHNR